MKGSKMLWIRVTAMRKLRRKGIYREKGYIYDFKLFKPRL